MKAAVINKYGPAEDVFEIIEKPKPAPAFEELLIKVMGTSINPIDYKIREGYLPHLTGPFPAGLHCDVAGIVEAVGPGVKTFKPGDNVYGCPVAVLGRYGALTEYIAAPAYIFSKIPKNLNYNEAAALPLAGITAYQAVMERICIKPGQKVLIYGGIGGVGHLALQLAKIKGAETYATVSTDAKADIAKSLGANHTINYRKKSLDDILAKYTGGNGFDVIIDTIGNENTSNSLKLAAIGGNIASIMGYTHLDISPMHEKGLSLHLVYMCLPFLRNDKNGIAHTGKILRKISKLVEEKLLRPVIDKTIPFEEAAQAHNYAETGNPSGKVIISIA